jgi:hypothetical protein
MNVELERVSIEIGMDGIVLMAVVLHGSICFNC